MESGSPLPRHEREPVCQEIRGESSIFGRGVKQLSGACQMSGVTGQKRSAKTTWAGPIASNMAEPTPKRSQTQLGVYANLAMVVMWETFRDLPCVEASKRELEGRRRPWSTATPASRTEGSVAETTSW